MRPTIYISMASMDDSEVIPTVENALSAATYPERIRIGVGFSARKRGDFRSLQKMNDARIRTSFKKIKKNSLADIGVGKGRLRAWKLYMGEDYFMQVDSHTHFADGWDEFLIKLYEEAVEISGNKKTILTSYIGTYKYQPERTPNTGRNGTAYPFFIPEALWLNCIPRWGDYPLTEKYPEKFYPSVKFNGAFAFGTRDFAMQYPYKETMLFYDEEVISSIELIDAGFSLVFPNLRVFPLTHLNGEDRNKYGGARTFVLEYLKPKVKYEFDIVQAKNYRSYINDPANAEKIKKYEQYSRVNVRYGTPVSQYIPRKYTPND